MNRTEAREYLMQIAFQMEAQGDFSEEALDKFFELNIGEDDLKQKKYMVSGNKACQTMMQAARRQRRRPDPEEESILAWARFDLMRETIGGFWDMQVVYSIL